ncbi:MAG: amidase family protein, partial [Candidatus Bathyarchaeota archaeon]|nr:amidase family protein [Candidatus Bathyarchaeota archaeon]
MIYKTITQLSEALRNGETTPTELTETSIQCLKEHGPTLNCVVTITEKRAYKQAKRAEEELRSGKNRGPLHGIPWGAKDLLATSGGIPTTWGAYPLREQRFDYDATVVKKLEEAGSVLVAKLAMIELAGGMGYRQPNASFTGPCATPWSLKHWSGGSSSGSGSAVSAGLVPFAIG